MKFREREREREIERERERERMGQGTVTDNERAFPCGIIIPLTSNRSVLTMLVWVLFFPLRSGRFSHKQANRVVPPEPSCCLEYSGQLSPASLTIANSTTHNELSVLCAPLERASIPSNPIRSVRIRLIDCSLMKLRSTVDLEETGCLPRASAV